MGQVSPLDASRDEIVPSKSKRCEQQGADANWHNQKAPGHVIDDNNQRIDAGRRVKRAGQMHCDHCQTNSDGGGHGAGPHNFTTSSPTSVETR
jgi:hypothetical protein